MSVSAEAFVEDAVQKSRAMVSREARGPGDVDNAMRRLEAKYGISYNVLWSLRYKKPKDVAASVYAHLVAAYEAQREHQRKLLEHEATIESAKSQFGRDIIRKAQSLARQDNGMVNE